MKLRNYPRIRFGLMLGPGALLAAALCFQCVRTYFYTDSVLVPQQAEREAERQAAALTTAARRAKVTDPRELGPAIERVLESASDHVLWMRVLNSEGMVVAQSGNPGQKVTIPADWWDRIEKHDNSGTLTDTSEGRALVVLLPFRMPRPSRPPAGGRAGMLIVELSVPLRAVSGAFEGLRRNLILGMMASIALLLSIVAIALHLPRYLRGRYLETELQLAKRVQRDLQPRQKSISPEIEFAAAAVAADHVGGDFHDVFDAGSGRIAIVLGDVSGKGISAALLVSVLQGAIRSSAPTELRFACEQINRMLCERTAGERFATLFWAVFDPASGVLQYVNAGHAAPMLVRRRGNRIDRLDAGGPVLGLLPMARYTAGTVRIDPLDRLVLYSDGVNEAANAADDEFGEHRIAETALQTADAPPAEFCERLMQQVATHAEAGSPPDDRTLLVVEFVQSGKIEAGYVPEIVEYEAVA